MVIQATGINTDPNCSKTMDPDMALGSSLDLDHILALCGSTSHSDQDGSGSGVVQSLDINKSTGCGPKPRLPRDLWW